jgi:guanylate kinase
METQTGILTVVSGFSGSGKGTIMKELIRRYESDYALSVSATTREPRAGEENGREYFFKTREEFEKMIEKNELIEYALYVENYYGTPKRYVEEQLEAGKDVILEIEVQGARKVREQFPDTLLLFVTPPDADTLRKRLIGRGTETAEVVEARLSKAYQESFCMEDYDFLIINDQLDDCVEEVHSIIRNAHKEMSRNQAFIHQMQNELKCFSKGEET